MSAASNPSIQVPEGFRAREFGGGFIAVNGPLYARRNEAGFQLGFRVEERHCNPMGICHGGMMATFCDMLLPISAHVMSKELAERFLPTINLQIDYLAASPLGAWVQGASGVAARDPEPRLHAGPGPGRRRQRRPRQRHLQDRPAVRRHHALGRSVPGDPASVVVAHLELADELLLRVRRHRLVVRELDACSGPGRRSARSAAIW